MPLKSFLLCILIENPFWGTLIFSTDGRTDRQIHKGMIAVCEIFFFFFLKFYCVATKELCPTLLNDALKNFTVALVGFAPVIYVQLLINIEETLRLIAVFNFKVKFFFVFII